MSRRVFRTAVRVLAALVVLGAGTAAVRGPCGPDLRVAVEDPAPVPAGGTTVVHATVVNVGDVPTVGPFSLVVQLPPGVVGTGLAPADCSTGPFGHTVTCTVPAGLAVDGSVTADVRLGVASGTDPGTLDGTVQADLPGDPRPADNSAHFAVAVK
ncbi:hypothetical protein [Kitasatospora sp. NPDC047058]|uniref:hypothetical protein n=1 Tax=Kitasatospora sp. NPDC047058 TaxID=3155620 RepID=UPI0033DE8AA5